MAAFPNLWLGLGLATGTPFQPVEPADAGYARQPVAFTPLSAVTPCTNTAPVTFGPAAGGWIATTWTVLWDAAIGGNALMLWADGAPAVAVGASLVLATGQVGLLFDNAAAILGSGGLALNTYDIPAQSLLGNAATMIASAQLSVAAAWPTVSQTILVVTRPFAPYMRGDLITDPVQVAAALASHPNYVSRAGF